MADHGSSENGINWADGYTEYQELHTVVTEAVVGFARLYAYGVSKVTFLSTLTGRTIHNQVKSIAQPPMPSITKLDYRAMPQIPQTCLGNQKAHSLYDWFMHYLQIKDYFQCPPDMGRH
jgi:hypothetical protein